MTRPARLLVLTAVLVAGATAAAVAYPTRPVRLVMPWAPGGATDIVARTIASALAKSMGQPFIVENRPGAGGVLGAEVAKNAGADGYSLLLTSTRLPLAIELETAAGRPVRVSLDAFTPVALVATESQGLVVRASASWTYGSPGDGAPSQVAVQALAAATSISLINVPYRGVAPAIADVIGGQIDMLVASPAVVKPHVDGGRLRALVSLGATQALLLPDTPTLREAGIAAPAFPSWFGLWAPAGTPATVQSRLHDALRAAAPPPSPLPKPAVNPSVFGRYHAIVIGNQGYRHLPRLKTPIADARAVADMLRTDYGFHTVRVLLDATRSDMVRALDDTRRQLAEDDNLLIYYAGHGWLDREADRGYWLGVDAGAEPVMDEGGAGHSVFARAFIETLRGAPAATDLSSLFGALRRHVLLRAEQTPQYGDLRLSGHDGGDFIFVRKP